MYKLNIDDILCSAYIYNKYLIINILINDRGHS